MATQENKPTLQEKLAASKEKTEEKKEDKTVALTGNYKSLRLKFFVKAKGQIVKPDAEGIFTPKDEEEFNMLEYYANQSIAYVERV